MLHQFMSLLQNLPQMNSQQLDFVSQGFAGTDPAEVLGPLTSGFGGQDGGVDLTLPEGILPPQPSDPSIPGVGVSQAPPDLSAVLNPTYSDFFPDRAAEEAKQTDSLANALASYQAPTGPSAQLFRPPGVSRLGGSGGQLASNLYSALFNGRPEATIPIFRGRR